MKSEETKDEYFIGEDRVSKKKYDRHIYESDVLFGKNYPADYPRDKLVNELRGAHPSEKALRLAAAILDQVIPM